MNFAFYVMGAGPLSLVWNSSCTCTSPSQARPIVLVHGGQTGTLHYRWSRQGLERRRFDVYQPRVGVMAADHLAKVERTRRLIEDHHLENVVLLGASIGGTVG
jgi:pimeloyl-ACP methyl ester carboxylesterase